MKSSDRLKKITNPSQSRSGPNDIEARIIAVLDSHSERLTPARLSKILQQNYPDCSKTTIRNTIKALVESGTLYYSNHYGRTCLEISYHRAIPISDRIILSPPHCSPPDHPDRILIQIDSGASFGMGDHPTTRIALCGLDYVMNQLEISCSKRPIMALDIGTGSGVLAIACVKLGATAAVGLDLDPVACHEARKNVELNDLDDAVTIDDTDLDTFDSDRFDVVMANLRPPTLKQMIPTIRRLSRSPAFWIMSGFRESEMKGMIGSVEIGKTRLCWQSIDHDWAGFVLKFEK